MIGFAFTVTAPGGSAVDYTQYVQNIQITLPATTAVPTTIVTLNNQTGVFASAFPLSSTCKITLPNGMGPFFFSIEDIEPTFITVTGGGQNIGHMVRLTGTAAPELLYLTEGNLDVVGTDIAVYEYGARPGYGTPTQYVPYPSTYIAALSTNLISLKTIFQNLINIAQPNQRTGYEGRLGYDYGGQGVDSTVGIKFATGATDTLYVKGQWQVGLGATGAQKSGIDIIRNVCTGNVIDGSGVPQYVDFYVDATHNNGSVPNPILIVFQRGSVNSGVTFTVGTDLVQSIDFPVDSDSVKNSIIYWSNPEIVYPNSGDAWSNYDTSGHLTSQWPLTVVSGSGTLTASATTPYSVGTSNLFTNTGGGNSELSALFDLGVNGYALLQPARNLSALTFQFKRVLTSVIVGSPINITIDDGAGHTAVYTVPGGQIPTSTAWTPFSIPIPASGHGAWATGSGWDFSLHTIAKITWDVVILTGDSFYFDYIQFTDNWQFSPTYSGNVLGAGSTSLKTTATAPIASFSVYSTAGLSPGQYVIFEPGTANEEVLQILSAGATTIITTTTSAITHASGKVVMGATHDPNSIAAYGVRPYNYVDFYITNGSSDSAQGIANSLLQQRKSKSSSGTITLSGYNQGVSTLKPGSLFAIVDPSDTYIGGAQDSVITGWIADQIQYNLSPLTSEGFTCTITVEPFYAAIGATSPDANTRNLQHWVNKNPGRMLAQGYRTTQRFSPSR